MMPKQRGFPSRYTDAEKLKIITAALNLKSEGVTWQRISDQLGVSRQTLRNWVAKFRKAAPIPLNSALDGESMFDKWEREEIKNLERMNNAYLKALDKLETLINKDVIEKEEAAAIKTVVEALTAVLRGLVEVNHLLSTKRRVDTISKGSKKLAKVREELAKKYQVG